MSERFGSKKGFVMASVGAAVGLGNALRFPGLCAKYGGGAFLSVYVLALIALGIPLLNAEIALGRNVNSGAPACMGSLARGGEKLGWAQSTNSLFTAILYSGISGWLLCEAFAIIPYCLSDGGRGSFFKDILHAGGDGGISGISPLVLVCIAAVWAAVYICLKGGARGLSSAAKFTVLTPVALLVVFTVRGCMYKGAGEALKALFWVDFTLLSSPELWINALGQVFFSLSLAVGIMPAYGSYLPERSSIFPLTLIIAAADASVSVLASAALFTTLYGCGLQGVTSPSGIITAFIIYPAAIVNLFENKVICGIVGGLFYFSLSMLAVQSCTSMLEAALSPLMEKFNLTRKRAAPVICAAGFLSAVVYATTAADIAVEIADRFVNFYAVVIFCICECLLIGHTKAGNGLGGEINRYAKRLRMPQKFYGVSVKFLCPAVLIVFLCPLIPEILGRSGYPAWAQFAFGHGLLILSSLSGFFIAFLSRERNTSLKK